MVGTIKKSDAEKYVQKKKIEEQKEADEEALKRLKDYNKNHGATDQSDSTGSSTDATDKKPKNFYVKEGEEIVTDISTFFRLLLIAIIIGMLAFSVILLLLVIWKGVGKDIQDAVYECIFGRGSAGGYQSIPEADSEMLSDKIVA